MSEKLTKEQEGQVDQGKCPDCGSQLLEGPRAGLVLDVKCGNPECAHRFWVPPLPFQIERLP